MTVRKIVIEYLKAHGYDGLYNQHEPCACEVENLIPCSGMDIEDCKPGDKEECPGHSDDDMPMYGDCGFPYGNCGFHIVARKKGQNED